MDEPLRALTIFGMVWLDGYGEPEPSAVQDYDDRNASSRSMFLGNPTNMECGCASHARLRRAFLKDQALGVYVF